MIYIFIFSKHLRFVPDKSNIMFLLRSRVFVGQFFRVAQSSLIETGPKVCAVKLMHTVNYYNQGIRVINGISILYLFYQVWILNLPHNILLGEIFQSKDLLLDSARKKLRAEFWMFVKLLTKSLPTSWLWTVILSMIWVLTVWTMWRWSWRWKMNLVLRWPIMNRHTE